ncbi:hypothetical protein CYMTET_50328 [Cymbomonas tetramitiformis]|uniref:Dynein heavy chain n=1 Tax=Cymbomonas tetramitiformis TaxID=36881 RepID=A0AAE0BQA5_9CHLO|nr:hypothetical protein CYMTET_50328 [Cymbomonas tetramitiformis]
MVSANDLILCGLALLSQRVAEAKVTEQEINAAREAYRRVGTRGACMYSLLKDLRAVHSYYEHSLHAFNTAFMAAVARTEPAEDLQERIANLTHCVTLQLFRGTSRGMFEAHKLLFAIQLTLRVMEEQKQLCSLELDFLLKNPKIPAQSPVPALLTNEAWGSVLALSNLENFRTLSSDIEGAAKRWHLWMDTQQPEMESMPQEWRTKTSMQKLCVLRALRPDRLRYATSDLVKEYMGEAYMESVTFQLGQIFPETNPTTPVLFVLTTGVDPVRDVEHLGSQMSKSAESGSFLLVSLGQGQEPIAEAGIEKMAKDGGWIFLQNIHLVPTWLMKLELILDVFHTSPPHREFRIFLSADPPANPLVSAIPLNILQTSIKITNEAPQDFKANLRRAFSHFSNELFEASIKQPEMKSIVFALSFFHATVLGRTKFGALGWSRPYPFNTGDLITCVDVLFNYLEVNSRVPWDDLKFMFGDIIYGGHITDDWDRRTCSAYLSTLLQEELFDEMLLAPGFPAPPNTGGVAFFNNYIEEQLPKETPEMFGLPMSAEISFQLNQSEELFDNILVMVGHAGVGADGEDPENALTATVEQMLDLLGEDIDLPDLLSRAEERTPYVSVLIQECHRMDGLIHTLRNSLEELLRGLKGELTMSEEMDALVTSLRVQRVPHSWAKVAYPSNKGLGMWVADLQARIKHLMDWSTELSLPKSVWLSALFNLQAFLTAVMQTVARRHEWPLDMVALHSEVTKKKPDEIVNPPREGAYIHGLFLEGALWDVRSALLVPATLKEMSQLLPVIYLKAILPDKTMVSTDTYSCPVYVTAMRGPTYVSTFDLKSKDPEVQWILAGVALLLEDPA